MIGGNRTHGHELRPSIPAENAGTSRKRKPTMVKKLVLALVAGGIVFSAAACNTVKGAGQDIESVGKAGDDAINR